MSELWSAEQHEWLSALGHTLYVPGSAEPPPLAAAAAPAARRAPSPPPSVPTSAPRPRAPRAEVANNPAPTHPPARRTASKLPDKLHFALIRASGCDPHSPEAAAAISSWPPSAELRGNPAAKRALWPQLRALRRRPPA